jgi:hypothetical protein
LPRNTQDAPGIDAVLEPRERQQREAAGDELEPEQHDHHQADREDQRADQRLTGGDCAREGEAGGGAEQRARQHAADQQVARRERELVARAVDHRPHHVGRLGIVHGSAPRLIIAALRSGSAEPGKTAAPTDLR